MIFGFYNELVNKQGPFHPMLLGRDRPFLEDKKNTKGGKYSLGMNTQMSFLKRTMYYLSRKKGKTLILFLLLFTVSAFVLTCFSILYATGEVAANMRSSVGAAFHIRSSAVNVSAQGTSETDNEKRPVVTEDAVQEIMKNDSLKFYNGRNSGYAKGLQYLPGAHHTEDNSMGQVSANHYSALHPHFQEGVLELAEGRHITPNDKNGILLSETLAALNGLSVGDTVSLSPAELAQDGSLFFNARKETGTVVKAEIIGVFRELEPQGHVEYQPTAGLRSNLIFAGHALLTGMGEAQAGQYTGGVSFYMQDPLYLNEIVDHVRQTDSIDWDSFFIQKDDFQYEKISSGLQTIQNLIKTLLVFVSVVSTAVLVLVLAMRMRGRVHEAGVLISVGVSKKEVLGQFAAEILVMAVLAFVCSFFAAGFVSGKVEAGILDKLQVVQIEEQALQTGLMGNPAPSALLTAPADVTLLIYTCLLAVILAATCLSALSIIKLKPREILSKMS